MALAAKPLATFYFGAQSRNRVLSQIPYSQEYPSTPGYLGSYLYTNWLVGLQVQFAASAHNWLQGPYDAHDGVKLQAPHQHEGT